MNREVPHFMIEAREFMLKAFINSVNQSDFLASSHTCRKSAITKEKDIT